MVCAQTRANSRKWVAQNFLGNLGSSRTPNHSQNTRISGDLLVKKVFVDFVVLVDDCVKMKESEKWETTLTMLENLKTVDLHVWRWS